jgi:quinol monooxygenase YgiN
MELFIFGRFHAREGSEDALDETVRKVVNTTREEAGCEEVHGFRSVRDPRLFYLHSHWIDEASFEKHAQLPSRSASRCHHWFRARGILVSLRDLPGCSYRRINAGLNGFSRSRTASDFEPRVVSLVGEDDREPFPVVHWFRYAASFELLFAQSISPV